MILSATIFNNYKEYPSSELEPIEHYHYESESLLNVKMFFEKNLKDIIVNTSDYEYVDLFISKGEPFTWECSGLYDTSILFSFHQSMKIFKNSQSRG